MDSHPVIDYEKFVGAYWENLTTVLRAFNPAEGFKFLEMWVPDENHVVSILNIVEAAKDAGLDGISVYVGPDTLRNLEILRLKEQAEKIGEVRTETKGEGIDVEVLFAEDRTSGDIYPAYRDRLRKILQSISHEGVLKADGSLVLVQATYQGVTLMALIDPSTHFVKKAAHYGNVSDIQRGMLETLCGILEEKPIQECSDHAVIYLEQTLRDPSRPTTVRGIVMPENADPAFALSVRLVRDLLADYRQRTGYSDIENSYDQPASVHWLALSNAERIERIHAAIESCPPGIGVQIVRLETVNRVVVEFSDAPDMETKQSRLMQLESYLKEIIEPTLQLYMQPKTDQNKIRKIKDVP